MNYEIYLKQDWRAGDPWPDDVGDSLLISAFNLEDRVKQVFATAPVADKKWVLQPQYDLDSSELPSDAELIVPEGDDERAFALSLCEQCGVDLASVPLCIDTTGFIVPSLLTLIRLLRGSGRDSVDLLYSEPAMYLKGEQTDFAIGANLGVRAVLGYEGTPDPANEADVLIIGVGYQHRLIQRVAQDKDHARVKAEVIGWPSLQAHMYQESVLAAARAADHVDPSGGETWFAPAADPFVTAQVLSAQIARLRERGTITNLYLSPLGPKPMALGFALFHILELEDEAASLIFPFSSGYNPRASRGLSRVWRYRLEFA